MYLRLFAVLLIGSALLAMEASAQSPVVAEAGADVEVAPVRSQTTGFFVKAHLTGTSLSVRNSDMESGGGGGVKLGYGISRLVTLYLGFDGAAMEPGTSYSYNYGMVDLGARFNFRAPAQALVPYVDVALTGQTASTIVDGSQLSMTGGGVTLGGGVQYFVTPTVALDAGLYGTGGSFNKVSYQGVTMDFDDMRSSSGRFTLGVTFYPF